MDCFLYDIGLRHERVKHSLKSVTKFTESVFEKRLLKKTDTLLQLRITRLLLEKDFQIYLRFALFSVSVYCSFFIL